MKRDDKLKLQVERSMEHIPVPDSLFRFAEKLPDRFAKGELELDSVSAASASAPVERRNRRLRPMMYKSAAAAAILLSFFTAGIKISPTFAELAKGVPGIDIAVEWLNRAREHDGVQTAIDNGYMPIEPVTKQIGGTTITIGDMYLTDEELLFKTFIKSDDFDVADAGGNARLFVYPENLFGGGSTTASSVITTTDGSGERVLQETYKYQLKDGAARAFLKKGEELRLSVNKHTADIAAKRSETINIAQIGVPIEPGKLLHDRVLEPNLPLPFADGDWSSLTLEKLTIQPTTMNLVLNGPKGWSYDFPREDGAAPYLKDDKGKVYRFDPSGPGLILEEGKLQLPFSSSVYFDRDVKSLTLHIGEMTVSEWEPSGTLELKPDGPFPQKVSFKGRELVIEGAEYVQEGYLRLKIKKQFPDQRYLDGVFFDIAEKEDLNEKFEKDPGAYDAYVLKHRKDRETFNVSGFGIAEDYHMRPYLSVFIPGPKLDRYTVTLARAGDKIDIDRDYTIPLKR